MTSNGQRGNRTPAIRTFASSATRRLGGSIPLAVDLFARSSHGLDDRFFTGLRALNFARRLGGPASELSRRPLVAHTFQRVEVVDAHDGDEGLALLLDDDWLTGVPHTVRQFGEMRPRFA